MNRGRSKTKIVESKHTAFSYYISLLAIFVLFLIGIRYYGSIDPYEHAFGIITFIECILALLGFVSLDILDSGRFKTPRNKEFPFKKFDFDTSLRGFMIFILLLVIQISTIMFMTIPSILYASAVIFAAIAEELFFRGLLIGGAIKAAELAGESDITLFTIKKKDKKMTLLESAGIFMSVVFFTALHQNYTGDQMAVVITLLSGTLLGITYWYWQDITVNILAHFCLNFFIIFIYYSGNPWVA